MPLHKPNGGFSDIPYSLKLAIVETNCKGCPYFREFRSSHEDETEFGCIYPTDLENINKNIREPYLTVSEIASNTCDYWVAHTKWQLEDNSYE